MTNGDMAAWTVQGLAPHRRHNSSVDGNRSPALRAPLEIKSRNWRLICRYCGSDRPTVIVDNASLIILNILIKYIKNIVEKPR